MNTGKRREREAVKLYEAAGYETFKPQESKFGETDMFGLFDILATKYAATPRLVQVSTNANGRLDFMCDAARFWSRGFVPEYLQVYKREGWRLMQPVDGTGEWETIVDDREHDGPMGEAITAYLETREELSAASDQRGAWTAAIPDP